MIQWTWISDRVRSSQANSSSHRCGRSQNGERSTGVQVAASSCTNRSQGWYSRTKSPSGFSSAARRGRKARACAGRNEWNSPNQNVTASNGAPQRAAKSSGSAVRSAARNVAGRPLASACSRAQASGAGAKSKPQVRWPRAASSWPYRPGPQPTSSTWYGPSPPVDARNCASSQVTCSRITSGDRLAIWVDGSRWTSSILRLNAGSDHGSWSPSRQGLGGRAASRIRRRPAAGSRLSSLGDVGLLIGGSSRGGDLSPGLWISSAARGGPAPGRHPPNIPCGRPRGQTETAVAPRLSTGWQDLSPGFSAGCPRGFRGARAAAFGRGGPEW